MYEHIEKVKKVVEAKGIKFTELRHERSFDSWMFDYEPKKRDPEKFFAMYGADAKGKSWATFRNRWCTGELKIKLMNRYFKELQKQYNLFCYIGIAADELKRLERHNQQTENHIHPLVNWGWTEQDCLNYCYSLGYDWGGLYEIFDRVSCWCCPLQPLEELRKLKKYFPDLWEELKDMDKRTWQKFKADYSVEELDKRFNFEEQRLAEGKSIRNREFFAQLREVLQEVEK